MNRYECFGFGWLQWVMIVGGVFGVFCYGALLFELCKFLFHSVALAYLIALGVGFLSGLMFGFILSLYIDNLMRNGKWGI